MEVKTVAFYVFNNNNNNLAKIQNLPSIFYQNTFHFTDFAFIYFSFLTFIQLRLFYQFLLYVLINFSNFLKFSSIFLNKKIQLMIEKYFSDIFFQKNINKSWQKCLNWVNLKLRWLKWILKKNLKSVGFAF